MTYPPLTAIGTDRTVDVIRLDRPVVMLCFAEATQHDADPIEAAVRAKYAAAQVLVGHVVDLHGVPRMFRGVAERILASEYEKAITALPAGEIAADYILILPDWDGEFVKSLGFAADVSRQLGVAVFAGDGRLLGTAQGDGTTDACLRLLTEAGA